MVNDNSIYYNISPTNDADFFFEKNSYFSGFMHSCIKICIFGTQLSHLWNTTVASLEHNRCFFGTKMMLLWNTTDASLEHN